MQKITPCLWFDGNAEEAVNFYVETFSNARITDTSRFTAANAELAGQPEGAVMSMLFEVEGQSVMALTGGPQFQFTPAISLMIDCKDQDEVDRLWDTLLDGGQAMQCGWLTDKFGVTWQIVPSGLQELIGGKDPEGAQRAVQAMLQMTKLDIHELQKAYDGA